MAMYGAWKPKRRGGQQQNYKRQKRTRMLTTRQSQQGAAKHHDKLKANKRTKAPQLMRWFKRSIMETKKW
jgi:hypothetical protein